MSHPILYGEKTLTLTSPRIDLVTDTPTGGSFGAYYNGTEIGTGRLSTFGPVGSSPSANGATVSGSVATLQPASATLPGVLTAIAQTIGGVKTFGSAPILSTGVYGVTPASSQMATINAAGTLGSLPFNTYSRVPIVDLVASAVQVTTAVAFTPGTYGDAVAGAGSIAVPAGNWCVHVTMQITGSDATGTDTFMQLDPTPLAVQSCSHPKCVVAGVENAGRFLFNVTAPSAWTFALNTRQDNAGGAGTAGYTQAEVVLWKIQ